MYNRGHDVYRRDRILSWRSGLAPTMMVNEDVHPKMTPDKAVKLIRELRGGIRNEYCKQRRPVEQAKRSSGKD